MNSGSALIRRLAAKGHEPMLIGRNGDKLAGLRAEVNAQYIVTELTNLNSVEAAVVNGAGSILLKPARITTETDSQQTLGTNLMSRAAITKRANEWKALYR